MKRRILFLAVAVFILFSCSMEETVPDTDVETASQFVQDIWKNDFKKAEKLLLQDETNKQIFDRFEQHFKTRPKAELDKYKSATLILNKVDPQNDSVSIINYSNSFNQSEKTDLKVVRKNGQWLIDIKYTIPTDTKE